MKRFPRATHWLKAAELEEGHPAKRIGPSDPILPALEFFLSLDHLPGFPRRLNLLEKEPSGELHRNTALVKWASHCAELGAISLLGQELGLEISGFDQTSPRALRPASDCDVVAEYASVRLFFEVKRRSLEDLQTPPPLLRARLLELDIPYSMSVEILDADYDCGELDQSMEELGKHLELMLDPENRSIWWPHEPAPPPWSTQGFCVRFYEKDESFGLPVLFSPLSESQVWRWLLDQKAQGARDKGAD